MSKRKAEEPFESAFVDASPASKKVRVEDVSEEVSPKANGLGNGQHYEAQSANHSGTSTSIIRRQDQEEHEEEDSEGSEVEDDSVPAAPLRQNAPTEGYSDLYLDTINRSVLDFDFEKLCSVTLSNINVYACLVCGKYFQGRGPKSHAYFHALEVDHHVYINMETKKVYVLPEGYEVHNKSLDDIKYVVDPKFTEDDVRKLDREPRVSTDLANKKYRPGFMGMNNIKANDYLNVVV